MFRRWVLFMASGIMRWWPSTPYDVFLGLGAFFKADPEKPLAALLLLTPVLVLAFFFFIFWIFSLIIGL